MSVLMLTTAERDEAARVSRYIGREFATARRAADDRQKNVAFRLGIRTENVARFELGHFPNVKLGTVVRCLGVYGLTLQVVPREGVPAAARPTREQMADMLGDWYGDAETCPARGAE